MGNLQGLLYLQHQQVYGFRDYPADKGCCRKHIFKRLGIDYFTFQKNDLAFV